LVFNRLNNVADIKFQALRFHYELLDLAVQKALSVARARLWNPGDYRSNPWKGFEPAFLNQVLDDFVRCIRVNFEFGRERPDRRKCLARLKFAADEGLFSGKYKLVENGFAGVKVEAEQCHMRTVTQVTVLVKSSSDP
jgi:hypothetical protein